MVREGLTAAAFDTTDAADDVRAAREAFTVQGLACGVAGVPLFMGDRTSHVGLVTVERALRALQKRGFVASDYRVPRAVIMPNGLRDGGLFTVRAIPGTYAACWVVTLAGVAEVERFDPTVAGEWRAKHAEREQRWEQRRSQERAEAERAATRASASALMAAVAAALGKPPAEE
jgi:hypothetical protein